jgi:hypothetical protein
VRLRSPRVQCSSKVDPTGVARPAGAQRLLSDVEHGAPYSFTAYKTKATSPEALAGWYRGSLRQAGFHVTEHAPGTLVAPQGGAHHCPHGRKPFGVVAAVLELR